MRNGPRHPRPIGIASSCRRKREKFAPLQRFLLVAAVSATAGSAGCDHDWDEYDPRLGSDAGGAGGEAGSSGVGMGGQAGAGGGQPGPGTPCVPETFASCYSGPSDTENIGLCRAGSRRCLPDKTYSDVCVGEITPAEETCGNPADEDCDGQTNEDCLCMPGTGVSCYEGPPNTENVGICASGFKVCSELGKEETACLQQILPKLEDCSTPEDDDCNASPNDQCPIWGVSFGGLGDQRVWGVAADPSGSIVVVGELKGWASFDAQELTSAGGSDVLVVKLSSKGDVLWSRRFGDSLDQSARAVAVDGAGNVLIAGVFQGTLKLGETWDAKHASLGGDDVFVVKLTSSGEHLWSRSFGGPGAQIARSLAVDSSGHPVVAGELDGSMDLDGVTTIAASSMRDGFVFKLLPGGAPVWAKRFGGPGDDACLGVATGPAGRIHIAGYFSESINFGGGLHTSGGGTEAFVARLSGAGDYVWSNGTKLPSHQRASGLAVNPQGDVAVLGMFQDVMDFGGVPMVGGGSEDLFVTKLDAAGKVVWSAPFGGFADEEPGAIAMRANGEVYFSAMVEGAADFGGGLIQSEGNDDVVAVKLSPDGEHLWSRRFGNFADQDATALSVLPSGSAAIAGDFAGKLNFGGGALASAGGRDIFVAELPP